MILDYGLLWICVGLQVYIVYMGERRYDEPQLVRDSHHEILSDILGRLIYHFSLAEIYSFFF